MYRIEAAKEPGSWAPHADVECGRISVILGSNGAGKSRLLQQVIHGLVVNKRPYLYIEGARAFGQNALSVRVDQQNWNEYGSPERAETNYKQRRGGALSQRLQFSLIMLNHRSLTQERAFYDKFAAWHKSDQKSPPPEKPETILQLVFRLFLEIFPYLEIKINEIDQICLSQGPNNIYPLSQASEGERQVFALLADLTLNADPHLTILIDEPDAHLNALLANRVWDTIERQLPEAQFIYASHSFAFGLRPSVESLFVMNKQTATIVSLDSVHGMEEDERTALLGSIPAVLTGSSALGVEGNDTSFDNPFYRWLLGDTDTAIVPLGGGKNVVASTQRLAIWKVLAPACHIAGVIDRDYMTNEKMAQTASASVAVLRYHEAESYLCFPDLLSPIAKLFHGDSSTRGQMDFTTAILEFTEPRLLATVARRVFQNAPSSQALSISNDKLKELTDLDKLKSMLEQIAESNGKYFESLRKNGTLSVMVDQEYRTCLAAIKSKNLEEVLAIFPGKDLLAELSKSIGFADETSLLSAVTAHMKADDFPRLAALKNELRAKLAG